MSISVKHPLSVTHNVDCFDRKIGQKIEYKCNRYEGSYVAYLINNYIS